MQKFLLSLAHFLEHVYKVVLILELKGSKREMGQKAPFQILTVKNLTLKSHNEYIKFLA